MKKELVVMSLFLIVFFSSCELKYTQYEIGIFNQSSYTLIVEYETIEGKETVKLEKEKGTAFYIEAFDSVLPEFTENNFNL